MNVVLASSSGWRAALLAEAGLPCTAVDPALDEGTIIGENPVQTAVLRAQAKAEVVARAHPDALVIGADQVIHLDGTPIGKPADDADWMFQLQLLRGRTHQLTTGVAIVERGGTETFHVDTAVRFRTDLTDEELGRYVAHGEARGCAGGYMIEKRGAWLVEGIDGDWLNVVGLPVLHLITCLRARGWRLPEQP